MELPERIEVEGGDEVILTWADGHVGRLSAAELRAACQCASCREPDGMRRTTEVLAGAVPVTIAEAKLVGGYAINFVFAPEGHGTGIYPFTGLRSLSEAMQEAADTGDTST
ncbi:MAG: DUF971 domain-containing protein [Acidimicrobiia bacterium]|nr:DUF971 domain-containing protein [Acidimicrobiia bacterium]